ncbi:SPOR domain-containing protein [Halopseudomonas maritima]|uniref:SPOR domain-containing protein n=1 Tax=Halopseudomonas maritima TaxID=2918528 RepID=UPI001EE9EAC2|nr:hypothetical protein [Halopseudomonas maritima]UJJ32914.1 hypothetical protein HV822_07135 [Halopseudomonas maritima]
MRSLFLFLLLLNILYALWQLQSGGVRPDSLLAGEPAVSDSVSSPPQDVVSASPAEVASVSEAAPAALCIQLGVFDGRRQAEQLLQRLLALDVQAALVEDEVVGSTDYWLVMPVSGGSVDALARLSLLQEQGIDSFVITRGPLAGNISLGVFSRLDYAEARQAQLLADGNDVRVESVDKLRSQYLVQVQPAARRLVDQSLLGRLRADFPQLQHQYQACSPVAKSGNLP